MESYKFLLDLAVILLCTKVLGAGDEACTDAAGCRLIACRSFVRTVYAGAAYGNGVFK